MTQTLRPFHIAVPVTDLAAAMDFYSGILGCATGRTAARWIDFNFFGHQLTVHLVDSINSAIGCNDVDNEKVPARHFGMVLTMSDWESLSQKLRELKTDFIIEPTIRFKGKTGEQATLFIRDPSGNVLEFKAFADDAMIFAH